MTCTKSWEAFGPSYVSVIWISYLLNKWSKTLYTRGVKAKPDKTFNTTEGVENTQKHKQGDLISSWQSGCV